MLLIAEKIGKDKIQRFVRLSRQKLTPNFKVNGNLLVFEKLLFPFVQGILPRGKAIEKALISLLFRIANQLIFIDFDLDDIGITRKNLLRLRASIAIKFKQLKSTDATKQRIKQQLFNYYILKVVHKVKETNCSLIFQMCNTLTNFKIIPTKIRDNGVGFPYNSLVRCVRLKKSC